MDATAETLFELPEASNYVQGVAVGCHRVMKEWAKVAGESHGLWTRSQAALLLGISRQRVFQCIEAGQIETRTFTIIEGETVEYITGDELIKFATREKLKGGRPNKARLVLAGFPNKSP